MATVIYLRGEVHKFDDMKTKIFINLFGTISAVALIGLGIYALKTRPVNNFSIAEICFFSVMLGINLVNWLKLYGDRRRERQGNQADTTNA